MKIVLDCRMSGKSGIGAFIDGILPWLIKSNNQFLLLGLSKENKIASIPEEVYNADNVSFLPCDIEIFSLKETFSFPKELKKIINSCHIYYTPYCNIPDGIKIPVFTTIHDIVFLDMPELAGKIGTFMRKVFYRRAVSKSKEIMTVSNFSKNRIIEKLKCRKNINVVYSALPAFLEEKISSQQKNSSIIFIGNIKKHKGLTTLIPAFKAFLETFDNNQEKPKLVIVGSQDNFRTQDNTINTLLESIPEENLEFTGYISDQDLKIKLSQAKILVQPSFYEGFGLPPLQALYCGTNALISDIEVFKEIYKEFPVSYFKTGDSDDLLNKIKNLWNKKEPEDIPAIYSFEKTAEKILDCFNKYSN